MRDFAKLSHEEMCEFAALTRQFEDELAANGVEICYTTGVEDILTVIEPYILDELQLLNVSEMVNAYVGFTHPHLSRPFEVTNFIEERLINLANSDMLSTDEAAEILY